MEQYEVVACRLKPRTEFHGRPIKEKIKPFIGAKLLLTVGWIMDENDPYPGEYALFGADKASKDIIDAMDTTWIASGDIEVVEFGSDVVEVQIARMRKEWQKELEFAIEKGLFEDGKIEELKNNQETRDKLSKIISDWIESKKPYPYTVTCTPVEATDDMIVYDCV